jgi:uncharacterized protein (TIRG00374 family)
VTDRLRFRRLATGAAGLALGCAFLWLALRKIDVNQMRDALRVLDLRFVAVSGGLYWLGLACRVERWHGLLNQLAPLRRRAVGETLLVGYAVNNLLPARLGELFRADYAKRRFRLSRSAVLGSIVIERLADLVAILACLGLGLLTVRLPAVDGALDFPRLLRYALPAILLAVLAIALARRAEGWRIPRLPVTITRRVLELTQGLRSLNRATFWRSCLLTVLIWSAESAALWGMLSALQLSLSPGQALLVMSAASLSTLVPTAPGYLGTYQLVFASALPVFGLSATLGVLGSVLIQVFLFGSVTVAGLVLYLARSMHNVGLLRHEAPIHGPEYRSR